MSTTFIGKPASRVDGHAKVTGTAKYAAEFNVPNLAYSYIINSSIAKGTITKIDASAALALDGVLSVFTHENIPRLAWFDKNYKDDVAPLGSPFRPLHNAKVLYSGQPIALVVADTFELARYAATLVKIEYAPTSHVTDLASQRKKAYDAPSGREGYTPPPKPLGKPDKAFAKAAVQHRAEYRTPSEYHNPMEMFGSTVIIDDDGTLIVYDKTQGVQNVQQYLCKIFKLSPKEVRVISPFVGGGFGSGLRPQYQVFLAVLAARELKCSVRVSMTRQQMFTFSHRSETLHDIALGATADGTIESIIHECLSDTSRFEDYTETIVNWSGLLYKTDNFRLSYKLAPLDVYTPCDMRAPGATQGVFAIESAIDELAYKLDIDPIELRLKNYTESDPLTGKPFSSKALRECFQQGASKFGWSQRNPKPRSMHEGNQLIGWGMATGSWEAMQAKSSARAILNLDGKLTVSSAAADIGTGTYTIMTQIAAETLGLPMEDVTFKLGDSSLPTSMVEGGSWTAGSTGTAVKEVCDDLRNQLFKLARKLDNSPFAKAKIEDIEFINAGLQLRDASLQLQNNSNCFVSITNVMRGGGVHNLEASIDAVPNLAKQSQYSIYSHNAVFVEVKVDEDISMVHVTRVVIAIGGGRILNPKTARSQILGGVVWGISMALQEDGQTDHHLGRVMNHNFGEYHIPVNADIHDIEVIFVEEHDTIVNPLGAKGLGEIGIVGTAAAVANAVFHATGQRVRNLPITPDKLL